MALMRVKKARQKESFDLVRWQSESVTYRGGVKRDRIYANGDAVHILRVPVLLLRNVPVACDVLIYCLWEQCRDAGEKGATGTRVLLWYYSIACDVRTFGFIPTCSFEVPLRCGVRVMP